MMLDTWQKTSSCVIVPGQPLQLRRDSNPQPPDSKSDTLSIAPRNFRTRATDDRGRLVVDAALEARRAPVDELDHALGLDRGDRGVDVLGWSVGLGASPFVSAVPFAVPLVGASRDIFGGFEAAPLF